MEIRPIIGQSERLWINKSSENRGLELPFKDLLKEAINQVNETDAASIQGNLDLLIDNETALHTVMINAEKADIALQYTLQIRNKLLDAYNEIMRMQI